MTIYRKPKKRGASAAAYPFSKAKYSGRRQDVITAEEYREQHKAPEKDLQTAVEILCGTYGWIRMGTLREEDIKSNLLNCPGVWFHVPNAAFYVPRGEGDPDLVSRNLANCPDIVMFRRDGRMRGLELKRKTNKRDSRRPGQKIIATLIQDIHLVKSSEHAEELIREFSQI